MHGSHVRVRMCTCCTAVLPQEVSAEFLAILGPDKLPYLQLVHQLIVCEENQLADPGAAA